MEIRFTEESFKEHTKMMLDYLKKQGFDIPLGKGLEATSRFCGTKSWNVMSTELKKPAVHISPTEVRKTIYEYRVGDHWVPASVTAAMYTDDYVHDFEFDATPYFIDADFDTLHALQRENWGYCEEADEVARTQEQTVPAIAAAFDYLARINDTRRECGFEVTVDEVEVYKCLRAFDYVTFVKLMLIEQHSLFSLSSNNFGVFKVPSDVPGSFAFRNIYRGFPSFDTYGTEVAAWEALGDILENDMNVSTSPEILAVVPWSGRTK